MYGDSEHIWKRAAGVSRVAVPTVLVGLGALHAGWALGSTWPARSEQELASCMLSDEELHRLGGRLPSAPLTALVALSLVGAAGLVRATASGPGSQPLRRAAWAVAAVFAARAFAYLPAHLAGREDRYHRLDRTLYAPLCLALAAGTAITLKEAPE